MVRACPLEFFEQFGLITAHEQAILEHVADFGKMRDVVLAWMSRENSEGFKKGLLSDAGKHIVMSKLAAIRCAMATFHELSF